MKPVVRVIKLGGSLLDSPSLAESLGDWLGRQSAAVNVLVVGGGALVEKLRELDRAQRLSSETMHWLAIRAMGITAAILCELFADVRLVDRLEALRLADGTKPQVLDVENFLRQDRETASALPESWDVTSDSIAARVAQMLGACELVLLKSALPDMTAREQLARLGFVDAYFPTASRGLAVRAVHLRGDGFPEVELK